MVTIYEEFFPDSDTIYHYTETTPKQEWNDDTLSAFSFGIAAYEGTKLSDIILCRITTENQKVAWLEVQDHNNTQLLTKAELQIRTNPYIRMIMIYTEYNETQKQLYKSRGYEVSSMEIWDGKPKAYLMTKLI
jgi:hypothetical protein